jgi:hypothetical protein
MIADNIIVLESFQQRDFLLEISDLFNNPTFISWEL